MNQPEQKKLICPLCHGTSFKEEYGRLESKWGASEHKVKMYACNNCSYVLLFSEGKTIWTVDD